MRQLASSSPDRRQTRRLAIDHHSRFRLTLDGAESGRDVIGGVTLTDISHEGIMAAGAGQFVPGARLIIEIPLVGWREAAVVWIANNRAGCRFLIPLSLEELRLAAVSSDRLAKECPAFAAQIAESGPLVSVSSDRVAAPSSNWYWPEAILALSSLGIISFLIASWLLN